MSVGESPSLSRRQALASLAGLGIGTATFQRALAGQAEAAGKVTPEMVAEAEWIAGITLTEDERKRAAGTLERDRQRYEALHAVAVNNAIPPALAFFAQPPQARREPATASEVRPLDAAVPERPAADEDLAFLPVTKLAALDQGPQGDIGRVDAAVSGAAQAVRRAAQVRRHAHRRGRSVAGRRGRSRDRRRSLSRPAARHSVGREGPDRLSGLQDDLGSRALQGADARHEGDGRPPAGRSRGGAGGQADARCAGPGRPVVRRHDPQPVESRRGIERLVGRLGLGVVAGLVGFAIGSETLGSIVSPCRSAVRPDCGRRSAASAARVA